MRDERHVFGAEVAGFAARRPRAAAGMVSVAGLIIGFGLAYAATALVCSLKPASSPTFLSATVSTPART